MCTGVELLLIGATGFNAVTQIQQGRERQKLNEFNAEQAEADAQAEREMGIVRAQKARRAGRRVQSEARAALSASGVEVGAGTALKIEQDIARRTEEDALSEILFGTRKGARLEQEAGAQRMFGKQARAAGVRGAMGSLLSGGATLASGWKTAKKTEGAIS